MDFQQGLITTIHEYGLAKDPVSQLNKDLLKRPTSILVPCLFDEFSRPALKLIRSTLKELKNLNQLVIALSAGKEVFTSIPSWGPNSNLPHNGIKSLRFTGA